MLTENLEVGKKYLTRNGEEVVTLSRTAYNAGGSTYYVSWKNEAGQLTAAFGDGVHRGSAYSDRKERPGDIIEALSNYQQEQLSLF